MLNVNGDLHLAHSPGALQEGTSQLSRSSCCAPPCLSRSTARLPESAFGLAFVVRHPSDCYDADPFTGAKYADVMEGNCADGVDNDRDGKTDCLDPDCADYANCMSGK